MIINFLRC